MALTIGNWFAIGLIVFVGIIILIYAIAEGSIGGIIATILITVLIVVGFIAFENWYHKSTASGIRYYKDFESEMANGIYRELTITAEDGREIFRYEGKFDLERHEDGDDRYLRFETQDGKRYTISYGIQDTVLIIEKDAPTKTEE